MENIVKLSQENDSILANPCGETNKEADRKCKHFSIRGYVSEVRKRNPEICYPFPMNDSIDLSRELPPMTIPKFRYWRCTGCVPKGNEEASNILAEQSSKVNDATKVQNLEANTSTDFDDDKNYSPILNVDPDRKGKGKAHVTNDIPPFSGCENDVVKDSSNQRTLQQTIGQIEVNQSADNEVDIRSRFDQNETIVALHTDCIGDEVRQSDGYVTSKVDYATKICRGESQTSSQNRHVDSPTKCKEVNIFGVVGGSRCQNQGLVNLPDLNDCNGEPLDEVNNEVTVSENEVDHLSEHDDNYLGEERRKIPKTRLVSGLLGLTEAQNFQKDEYVKRKMVRSENKGLKFMGVRGFDDEKKITETCGVSELEYEYDFDDVSTKKVNDVLAKRRYKSKSSLLETMNNSTSLSQHKIELGSNYEKGKSSEESPPRVDLFAHLSETNSILRKKRGKVFQARKEPITLILSKTKIPKEIGATQKDEEVEQNAAENVQKPSENDHYLLNNYPNKENNHLFDQRKIEIYPSTSTSTSKTDQMLVVGNIEQKEKGNRNLAENSLTFETTYVGATSIENKSDGDGSINPTTNSSEKKAKTPEANGCSPPAQHIPMQVSNSVSNQKELTNEVQGRVQIDINTIPIDDEPNEQGAGDNIPMDIVEITAKNKYERHLDGAMNRHDFSIPPALSATHVRENEAYRSCGQPMQIFVPFHLPSSQKSPSVIDPRIFMFNEDLGHNYSYYNGNSRDNPGSSRFHYVNQGVEHIHPYSAPRLPPRFLQEVYPYKQLRACGTRQSLTEIPRVWPPRMTSRMPLGITSPQMISQSSNILDKGRIRHHGSGSLLNFNAASNLENHLNTNVFNAYNNENSDKSSRFVDVNEAFPALHLQNNTAMQNTELSLGPPKLVGPYNGNISSTSIGIMGHIPMTLQEQMNMQNYYFARVSKDQRRVRPSTAPLSEVHQHVIQPMTQTLDKEKDFTSTLKPAHINNPLQGVEESPNLKCGTGVRCNDKTISLTPDKLICQLNQNPSEFTDLNLMAQYMIGPEDLKPRKSANDVKHGQ